jgi:hypothetical protein
VPDFGGFCLFASGAGWIHADPGQQHCLKLWIAYDLQYFCGRSKIYRKEISFCITFPSRAGDFLASA